MRRYLKVFFIAALTACVPVPPPPGPEPLTVATDKPRTEVAAIAVRELTESGFDIQVSDPVTGVISAKRTRPTDQNADFIACQNKIGSKGAMTPTATNTLTSTVTITVTTQDSSGMTVARIVSRAEGSYTFAIYETTHYPVQCSSKGDVEKRIAVAISS